MTSCGYTYGGPFADGHGEQSALAHGVVGRDAGLQHGLQHLLGGERGRLGSEHERERVPRVLASFEKPPQHPERYI